MRLPVRLDCGVLINHGCCDLLRICTHRVAYTCYFLISIRRLLKVPASEEFVGEFGLWELRKCVI